VTRRSHLHEVKQSTGPEAAGSDLGRPGPLLLETKLHVPTPSPAFVPRPHLLALLDAGAGRQLTLVQAPTGFGKTTLLAAWCASVRHDRPCAWVSLGSDDNDPLRLWTYLIEALHRVDPAVGARSLAALRAPGVSLLDVVLPLLLNELADLAHPVILVLDDYQMVENQECHRSVAFLIEHLPKTVQLVLSTHSNPPLPLGRLRARGQLLELQGADLRFTGEETAALLNDRLQLKLDPADLAVLHDRTEGWPAGLHLAALTLKGHPDPHTRVKSFSGSHRHVIDYLGAELLDAQPPPLRRFLLRTSILERLSADLCDAVTDSQGAAGLLRQLERANLFLLPLDEWREWYRYHHLFADLLRHELAASEPELIAVLHRRASAWYRQAGFPDEAIHHASAAGDLDEVSELIARHWISYVDRWLIATVRDWLRALPPAAVRSDPVLTLVSAWIALTFYEPAEMDRWLAIAEQLPSQGPLADGTPSLEVGIVSLRAISGYQGIAAKLAAARRVLDLQPDPASPWRLSAFWALGYSLYLSGRTAEARAPSEEAVRLGEDSPVITTRIRSLALLGLIEDDQGQGDAAAALERRASELVQANGLSESPTVADAYTLQGRIHRHRGDLDGALAAHERAYALQRYPIERFHALVELLPARLARGDQTGAETLVAEADRLQATGTDFGVLPQRLRAATQRLDVAEHHMAQPSEALSAREVDVLRLLSGQLSQQAIGDALYITRDTVKSHTKAVYRKLGVSSREEAVALARRLGLIP
jgi:LuxR family transcriptional regulator, maltose regulon positive regulatory protein